MAVKFSPINSQEIKNGLSSGSVSVVAPYDMKGSLSQTVMDPAIFGTTESHKGYDMQYEDRYRRMGHIHLASPVVNPFLLGRNGETLKVILGDKRVSDIMSGKIAYDIETGEYIYRNNAEVPYDPEKHYFGGQLLRLKLWSELDVDMSIKFILYWSYIYPCLTSAHKKMINQKLKEAPYATAYDVDTGEEYNATLAMWETTVGYIDQLDISDIKDSDGKIVRGWLTDTYVFDANPEYEYVYNSLKSISIKNIMEAYDEEDEDDANIHGIADVYQKQAARLQFLLAIRDEEVKTSVYYMIMDDVMVLPEGYRMTIEDRVNSLTTQYNQLVKLNNELSNAINFRGSTLKIVLMKYEKVVKCIRNIFMGDKDLMPYMKKDYKPLTKRLSSKEGLIRDKMQGSRVDYSGRTVITCDPSMPLDKVGVPKRILAKLLEVDVADSERERSKNGRRKNMTYTTDDSKIRDMTEKAVKLAENCYLVTGRQPTLFYLGIQAFKIVPVDGNSLVLSPLVVMPFNADFDGDQMHYSWAITPRGKKDVAKLMASTENLFYPRNGELTVVPRHEILYGLWICSKIKEDPRARSWSESQIRELSSVLNIEDSNNILEIVFEGVCRQEIAVYDKINCNTSYGEGMNGKTAGVWAVKYALGKVNAKYALGVMPLTVYGAANGVDQPVSTKWFKALFAEESANVDRKEEFITIVNKMVKLGFAVAEIWPPSITSINDINVDSLIDKFNRDVAEREELVAMGIEIEAAFTNYFNQRYKELQDEIKKVVVNALGEDSGFVRMWKSGAKGNDSNLIQMFGSKGRIMKNDLVAFNTIIKNSLSNQLTGLEDFITAYGSRQGLADKTLSTAKPGYLTRKLEHAASNMAIRSKDCGTKNGINWTYDDILPFIDISKLSGKDDQDINTVRDFLSGIIVGRYLANSGEYIANTTDAENAFTRYIAEIGEDGTLIKKSGLKMRSPITCECPVCQMCYGKDLTTNNTKAKIGKPVGFVAAQSIGEPGTQLTMKNFQRGGIVSEDNLTSAFDSISAYFHLYSFGKTTDGILKYDALSPVEGNVKAIHMGDGRKRIFVYEEDHPEKNLLKNEMYVPEMTELKSYVKRGDSFCKIQGNLDIKEVMKYRSVESAYKYLVLMMYNLFNDYTEVNAKHFEIIIASMMSFVIGCGVGEYKTGQILSTIEYWEMPQNLRKQIIGTWTIIGILELPKYRRDFFESIILERMGSFVRRAIITNPVDSMRNPKTRIGFGLPIGMGSDVPGYLED